MINSDQAAWLRRVAAEDEPLAATMHDFLLGVKPVPTGVELHRAKEIAGAMPPKTVPNRAE